MRAASILRLGLQLKPSGQGSRNSPIASPCRFLPAAASHCTEYSQHHRDMKIDPTTPAVEGKRSLPDHIPNEKRDDDRCRNLGGRGMDNVPHCPSGSTWVRYGTSLWVLLALMLHGRQALPRRWVLLMNICLCHMFAFCNGRLHLGEFCGSFMCLQHCLTPL